ncbi:MAG: endonuclease III [Acidobacteriota bacterium]
MRACHSAVFSTPVNRTGTLIHSGQAVMATLTVPRAAARAARGPRHDRRRQARRVIDALRETYPDADCALVHRSAWQLLVATILSAQCTDRRVNQVTGPLFRRFRSIRSFAAADVSEIETLIRSTGFFRNKARAIRDAARSIIADHNGRVPREMDDLIALPGVGRKTAHVVRGTWFHLPAITVDTHVGRLSRRLGLTAETDPVKVEHNLAEVWPEADRTFSSHALIWHGRQICAARRPACGVCSMSGFCPSASHYLAAS